jgi:signal transduction histidine kinase
VLGHLLNNAVKFSEAGGVVTISAGADDGGGLLIRVADTGIGIAEPDLDRVFEPFTQIDASLSRRFDGSGLGLYMSRALVQAHGGSLVLHSRPGAGTTAEIRLPAERLLGGAPRPTKEDLP